MKKKFIRVPLLMCITLSAALCFGCSKKQTDTDKPMSTDTITFTKATDDCTSTLLFSFEKDKVNIIGGTETYASRELARSAYESYEKDSDSYINLNIDSKDVTYNYSDSKIKKYASMKTDDIVTSLENEGYKSDYSK